jgi:hypothetical protein
VRQSAPKTEIRIFCYSRDIIPPEASTTSIDEFDVEKETVTIVESREPTMRSKLKMTDTY